MTVMKHIQKRTDGDQSPVPRSSGRTKGRKYKPFTSTTLFVRCDRLHFGSSPGPTGTTPFRVYMVEPEVNVPLLGTRVFPLSFKLRSVRVMITR